MKELAERQCKTIAAKLITYLHDKEIMEKLMLWCDGELIF